MAAWELSIVLQSLLTLVVLAVVVLWLWPEQRNDLFRQQMFAIRDDLWDFADAGNISFDDPAYVLLRQLMNGLIRYAHNLTPYRIFFSFLRWKYTHTQPTGPWAESWNEALNQLDDKTKETLQRFHARATDLVLGQIVLSPGMLIIFAALAPLFVLVVIVGTQWTNLKTIYRDLTNTIPTSFIEEEAAKA